MVEKPQRRSWLEQPAALQLHAVAGIFRVFVEHLAEDLTNHHVGPQLPPGKHPLAQRSFLDANLSHQPIELALRCSRFCCRFLRRCLSRHVCFESPFNGVAAAAVEKGGC